MEASVWVFFFSCRKIHAKNVAAVKHTNVQILFAERENLTVFHIMGAKLLCLSCIPWPKKMLALGMKLN